MRNAKAIATLYHSVFLTPKPDSEADPTPQVMRGRLMKGSEVATRARALGYSETDLHKLQLEDIIKLALVLKDEAKFQEELRLRTTPVSLEEMEAASESRRQEQRRLNRATGQVDKDVYVPPELLEDAQARQVRRARTAEAVPTTKGRPEPEELPKARLGRAENKVFNMWYLLDLNTKILCDEGTDQEVRDEYWQVFPATTRLEIERMSRENMCKKLLTLQGILDNLEAQGLLDALAAASPVEQLLQLSNIHMGVQARELFGDVTGNLSAQTTTPGTGRLTSFCRSDVDCGPGATCDSRLKFCRSEERQHRGILGPPLTDRARRLLPASVKEIYTPTAVWRWSNVSNVWVMDAAKTQEIEQLQQLNLPSISDNPAVLDARRHFSAQEENQTFYVNDQKNGKKQFSRRAASELMQVAFERLPENQLFTGYPRMMAPDTPYAIWKQNHWETLTNLVEYSSRSGATLASTTGLVLENEEDADTLRMNTAPARFNKLLGKLTAAANTNGSLELPRGRNTQDMKNWIRDLLPWWIGNRTRFMNAKRAFGAGVVGASEGGINRFRRTVEGKEAKANLTEEERLAEDLAEEERGFSVEGLNVARVGRAAYEAEQAAAKAGGAAAPGSSAAGRPGSFTEADVDNQEIAAVWDRLTAPAGANPPRYSWERASQMWRDGVGQLLEQLRDNDASLSQRLQFKLLVMWSWVVRDLPLQIRAAALDGSLRAQEEAKAGSAAGAAGALPTLGNTEVNVLPHVTRANELLSWAVRWVYMAYLFEAELASFKTSVWLDWVANSINELEMLYVQSAVVRWGARYPTMETRLKPAERQVVTGPIWQRQALAEIKAQAGGGLVNIDTDMRLRNYFLMSWASDVGGGLLDLNKTTNPINAPFLEQFVTYLRRMGVTVGAEFDSLPAQIGLLGRVYTLLSRSGAAASTVAADWTRLEKEGFNEVDHKAGFDAAAGIDANLNPAIQAMRTGGQFASAEAGGSASTWDKFLDNAVRAMYTLANRRLEGGRDIRIDVDLERMMRLVEHRFDYTQTRARQVAASVLDNQFKHAAMALQCYSILPTLYSRLPMQAPFMAFNRLYRYLGTQLHFLGVDYSVPFSTGALLLDENRQIDWTQNELNERSRLLNYAVATVMDLSFWTVKNRLRYAFTRDLRGEFYREFLGGRRLPFTALLADHMQRTQSVFYGDMARAFRKDHLSMYLYYTRAPNRAAIVSKAGEVWIAQAPHTPSGTGTADEQQRNTDRSLNLWYRLPLQVAGTPVGLTPGQREINRIYNGGRRGVMHTWEVDTMIEDFVEMGLQLRTIVSRTGDEANGFGADDFAFTDTAGGPYWRELKKEGQFGDHIGRRLTQAGVKTVQDYVRRFYDQVYTRTRMTGDVRQRATRDFFHAMSTLKDEARMKATGGFMVSGFDAHDILFAMAHRQVDPALDESDEYIGRVLNILLDSTDRDLYRFHFTKDDFALLRVAIREQNSNFLKWAEKAPLFLARAAVLAERVLPYLVYADRLKNTANLVVDSGEMKFNSAIISSTEIKDPATGNKISESPLLTIRLPVDLKSVRTPAEVAKYGPGPSIEEERVNQFYRQLFERVWPAEYKAWVDAQGFADPSLVWASPATPTDVLNTLIHNAVYLTHDDDLRFLRAFHLYSTHAPEARLPVTTKLAVLERATDNDAVLGILRAFQIRMWGQKLLKLDENLDLPTFQRTRYARMSSYLKEYRKLKSDPETSWVTGPMLLVSLALSPNKIAMNDRVVDINEMTHVAHHLAPLMIEEIWTRDPLMRKVRSAALAEGNTVEVKDSRGNVIETVPFLENLSPAEWARVGIDVSRAAQSVQNTTFLEWGRKHLGLKKLTLAQQGVSDIGAVNDKHAEIWDVLTANPNESRVIVEKLLSIPPFSTMAKPAGVAAPRLKELTAFLKENSVSDWDWKRIFATLFTVKLTDEAAVDAYIQYKRANSALASYTPYSLLYAAATRNRQALWRVLSEYMRLGDDHQLMDLNVADSAPLRIVLERSDYGDEEEGQLENPGIQFFANQSGADVWPLIYANKHGLTFTTGVRRVVRAAEYDAVTNRILGQFLANLCDNIRRAGVTNGTAANAPEWAVAVGSMPQNSWKELAYVMSLSDATKQSLIDSTGVSCTFPSGLDAGRLLTAAAQYNPLSSRDLDDALKSLDELSETPEVRANADVMAWIEQRRKDIMTRKATATKESYEVAPEAEYTGEIGFGAGGTTRQGLAGLSLAGGRPRQSGAAAAGGIGVI